MALGKCAPNVKPIYTKHRIIGLLGGSFNPAHAGHLHLSVCAIKALRLDEVWWLVTPQNPLKDKHDLAGYRERLASAQRIAQRHNIMVSDIEAHLRTRYTYHSLQQLQRRFPGTQFIWLMGADNLAGFHRWHRWQDILRMMPVAVMDRVPFSHSALRSKAASYARQLHNHNNQIAGRRLVFLRAKRLSISSTQIRKNLEKH